MKKNKLFSIIILVSIVFGSCVQKTDKERIELTMIGNPFLYNTIKSMIPGFEKQYGISVSFEQMTDRDNSIDTVAVGAADMAVIDGALRDDFMEKYRSQGIELLHIPTIIEIVGVSYNLNGVFPKDEPVYFTPELLYLIFTGEITRWNDPRIIALNHKVAKNKNRVFPDIPIIVLGRSDNSGNYFNMAQTLNKVCSAWREKKIGFSRISTELKHTVIQHFITGGVNLTAFASTHVGSIWFSDHATTEAAGLSFGALQNADGNFVTGNISQVMNTIENQTYPSDLRLKFNYLPGRSAPFAVNPIYVIVRKEQMIKDTESRTLKRAMLLYIFLSSLLEEQAQIIYFRKGYVPSPKKLLDAGNDLLDTMTYKGDPIDHLIETEAYLLRNDDENIFQQVEAQ